MGKLMGIPASQVVKTVSGYSYSSVSIDALGAVEYTIVRIAVDKSSSVYDFKADLEKALESCIKSCKKSAREENILVSVEAFNSLLEEIHGFVPLPELDPAGYKGTIDPNGSTALYDAALSSLEAVKQYGESLEAMDYLCNGIIFVITDGQENDSVKANRKKIQNIIARMKKEEKLESVQIILVGIGDENETRQYLDDFRAAVGIDSFIWVGSATAARLAKLANFVSRSISSTSMALGSGQQPGQSSISF